MRSCFVIVLFPVSTIIVKKIFLHSPIPIDPVSPILIGFQVIEPTQISTIEFFDFRTAIGISYTTPFWFAAELGVIRFLEFSNHGQQNEETVQWY
jgi:hypothetical protein